MLPTNPWLITFINPGIAWAFVVLGLCIWMVFRPYANEAPKILLVSVAFLILGPICGAIMNAESRGFPLRFDYFLYLADKSLGLSAFSVARFFSEWQRSVLYVIYQFLMPFMIFWYGVNLRRGDGRANKLLIAYLASYVVGPCLYLIVPACGPVYAFGNAFPMESPDVLPVLVQLKGWPNAIPSLHVSTALLFVLFAGPSRVLRTMAWLYLAGTVGATLAFEHYLIDLIVAVPFACFAALAAEGMMRKALGNLALVLGWLLSIRFATPELVLYPVVLRILALATIGFASFSMMSARKTTSREFSQPLSTEHPQCLTASPSSQAAVLVPVEGREC